MKRGTIISLKLAIFVIGIIMLGLCVIWLPWMAGSTAEMYPAFAYLKFPVLIGMYITAIPFFAALYQSLKLLRYIESGNAFSELVVISLKHIKHCAMGIIILYIIGLFFLVSQSALHPGIAIIGLAIIFGAFIIAVFAAVLQELLRNALEMKSENDLTV